MRYADLLLVGLLTTLTSPAVFAERLVVSATLPKAQLVPAGQMSVTAQPGSLTKGIARVSLRFRDDLAPSPPRGAWSFSIQYTLQSTGGPPFSAQGLLTIERRSDEEHFEAVGVHAGIAAPSVQLRVTTVTSPDPIRVPTAIDLRLELETLRFSAFDPTRRPTLNYNSSSPNKVSFAPVNGAEEYECECVFVDQLYKTQPGEPGPFDRSDPVRVRVDKPECPIDRYHPAGKLYLRARAVGRHIVPGVVPDALPPRPGTWSTPLEVVIAGHEPGKTWQYLADHSDGGRRRLRMDYHDGTSRARQTVTGLEAESSVLVTEPRYDLEGRQAVSILPAPRPGIDLAYNLLFNTAKAPAGPVFFGPEAFSGTSPQPLSLSTGAGKYFSQFNDTPGPARDFVPDAGGYPYAAMEYTRDGTDRLRRASQPGRDLRMGIGHDTIYLYGSASEAQLDRLFGSNAGGASHYERNVVLDANRQSKVNYVDRDGRVVASALAGDAPEALVSIAPPSLAMRFPLDEANVLDRLSGVSKSIHTIVNETPANYHFSYDFKGVDYREDLGIPDFPALCTTCRYQLTIRIRGPSGALVPLHLGSTEQNDPGCTGGGSVVSELTQVLENQTPPSCQGSGDRITTWSPSPQIRFCAQFTDPGEYEVTKILTFVSGDLDAHVERTVAKPGFFDANGYLETPDPASCGVTCNVYCASVPLRERAQCLNACNADWTYSQSPIERCKSLRQALSADAARTGGSITAHPEYCHLELCESGRMAASEEYDTRMASVQTYADAHSAGWLNPLGMLQASVGPPTTTTMPDPYFQAGAVGGAERARMQSYLLQFTSTLPNWQGPVQSLWQFASDPASHAGAPSPVSPDAQWNLFRNAYFGLKNRIHAEIMERPAPAGLGCSYWDDPAAHVKRPSTFDSADAVLAKIDEEMGRHCDALCPLRARVYAERLAERCNLDSAVQVQVEKLLRDYCLQTCGPGNPLGVITREGLGIGADPLLQQVQGLLGPSCQLSDVAIGDPYTTRTICRQVCCKGLASHDCMRDLFAWLGTEIPFRRSETKDLRQDRCRELPGEACARCIPWADELKIAPEGLEFWTSDRARHCVLQLYGDDGRLIPPDRVEAFGSLSYRASPPPVATSLVFTNVAIEVQVGAHTVTASIYTNCRFPWVRESKSVCTMSGICAMSGGAGKTVADRYLQACSSPSSQSSRAGPNLRLESSSGDEAPSGKPDCSTCALDALGVIRNALGRPRNRLVPVEGSPCFEKVRAKGEGFWLEPRGDVAMEPCRIWLYDANGRIIPVVLMASLGSTQAAAALPPGFATSPLPSGNFAGATVEVHLRSSEQPVLGYIFSDCDLVGGPGCRPDCSIGTRPGRCARELFRTLASHLDSLRSGETPTARELGGTTCFQRVVFREQEVRFVRQSEQGETFCDVTLTDAQGTPLSLDDQAGIVGPVRPLREAPPSLPMVLPSGLPFAWFAVSFAPDISAPENRLEAFLFSNCDFGLEPDCERTVVGVNLPGFPPSGKTPTEVCRDEKEEEAEQAARIELERRKGEFRRTARNVHHNRCFEDGKFRESFSYTTVVREYHHTLSYYDQARNLVQTVPPAGAALLTPAQVQANLSGSGSRSEPIHRMRTRFRYDSANRLVLHDSPDAGTRRLWYDDAGQLRFSQDSRQASLGEFSYIRYDAQGRTIETGVVSGVTEADILEQRNERAFPNTTSESLREAVRSYYDTADDVPPCAALSPRHLRGRVAAVVADWDDGDAAVTCYSYDAQGFVAGLLQVVPGLDPKRVDYEYDPVSQRVNAIHYQAGQPDQLHHRYEYDANGRLVTVESSRDGVLWDADARYLYYKHGPLARLELGDASVQGLDFTYTIQGWPKGVNSGSLVPERDPGRDGAIGSPNATVARDAVGFCVGYFHEDYLPLGLAAARLTPDDLPHPEATWTGPSGFTASAMARGACTPQPSERGCGLYDGSPAHTVSALRPFMLNGESPLGTAYRYDQLYRLRTAIGREDLDTAANRWAEQATTPQLYGSVAEYDANGNLTRLDRLARNLSGTSPPSQPMDALVYRYRLDTQGRPQNNRLLHVNDGVPAGLYPEDLDDQGNWDPGDPNTNNYAYDACGRLVRDRAAGLDLIEWDAGSRVRRIRKGSQTIEYRYDGLGNRVAKIVKTGTAATNIRREYYVRDERGTVLATYSRAFAAGSSGPVERLTLDEHTVLGAARLGIWMADLELSPTTALRPPVRIRGQKEFEITNYLGTVLATISDRKQAVPDQAGTGIDHHEPIILSAVDREAFGGSLPGRAIEPSPYRYGFNGLERDDELKGAGNSYYTPARLYDPRVGRWVSVDPVALADQSSYTYVLNNPLRYVDPSGEAPESEYVWDIEVGTEEAKIEYSMASGMSNAEAEYSRLSRDDQLRVTIHQLQSVDRSFLRMWEDYRVSLSNPLMWMPMFTPGQGTNPAIDFGFSVDIALTLDDFNDWIGPAYRHQERVTHSLSEALQGFRAEQELARTRTSYRLLTETLNLRLGLYWAWQDPPQPQPAKLGNDWSTMIEAMKLIGLQPTWPWEGGGR